MKTKDQKSDSINIWLLLGVLFLTGVIVWGINTWNWQRLDPPRIAAAAGCFAVFCLAIFTEKFWLILIALILAAIAHGP